MDSDRRKMILGASGVAAGALMATASSPAESAILMGSDEVSYLAGGTGAVTRTVQEKLRERITLEDFGAVGDAVTDDRVAVDKAIQYLSTFGGGTIRVGSKEYYLGDTVFLPEGVDLEFVGDSSKKSIFRTRNHGAAGFRYVRSSDALASASNLTFRGITFQELGFSKTPGGAAILFWGFDEIGHNNFLYCFECSFIGYDSAVWTRFTGKAKFSDCYYWNNNIAHRMDRDASFHWFTNCLALNNTTWINADDSRGLPAGRFVSDGISNTIVVEGCVSVNSAGRDIYINGWQSVYIAKGGCDGGIGIGGAAIHLQNVQDFSIDAMYVSSASKNNVRAGLYLEESLRGQVRGCSFVSCDIGLLQSGPGAIPPVVPTAIGNTGTKLVVDGNTFRDNKENDLKTNGYLRSSKIVNNHFGSQTARAGSAYEVYINDSNSTSNIVKHNTFSGSSYPIISGAGSLIGDNVFGAI